MAISTLSGQSAFQTEDVIPVKIRVLAKKTTDRWARHHRVAIDQHLASTGAEAFWLTGPFKVASATFTFEETVNFTPGEHFVEYANSAFCRVHSQTNTTLAWEGKIWINDELKAEGCVGRGSNLIATFRVGPGGVTRLPKLPVFKRINLIGRIRNLIARI